MSFFFRTNPTASRAAIARRNHLVGLVGAAVLLASAVAPPTARADGTECFLGEVRFFAGVNPPAGWAFAHGQLLPISQNAALFSILGTYYGGDGKSTFALPDLRGRVAIGAGQGPLLTARSLGEAGGEEQHQLTVAEMPMHSHSFRVVNGKPPLNTRSEKPEGKVIAGLKRIFTTERPDSELAADAVGEAGGDEAHNVMQPFQVLTPMICIQGYYPLP